MNKADENKWVKLSFLYRDNHISVRYEDGYKHRVVREGKNFRTVNDELFGIIKINRKIDFYLSQMLKAAPQERSTIRGTKNVPLAIFIENVLPNSLKRLIYHPSRYFSINPMVHLLFNEILQQGSYQLLYYIRDFPKRPFALPFNIRFAGKTAEDLMGILKDANWYANNPQVEGFGISLKKLEEPSFQWEEDLDIIVLSDNSFIDKLIQANIMLPRLTIILNCYSSNWFEIVRQGGSLLYLDLWHCAEDQFFLKEFFYSIIHDFPLHEALEYSKSKLVQPYHLSEMLFASPASNQSLRMVDALDSFKLKVLDYSRVINPGQFDQFLGKLPLDTGRVLGSALPKDKELPEYFNYIKSFSNNFNQETTGLIPLVNEYHTFKETRQPVFDQFISEMQLILKDKKQLQIIQETQERKVDVTLDELNSSLIYVPASPYRLLGAGQKYRLNVSIGQRTLNSLMVGEIGSIDPLLPDPEDASGHELEVVVFPKDFILASPSRQKIYLPLLGGSETAQFILQVPEYEGTLELRIAIFCKNHLLQAFLLQASGGKEATSLNEPAVQVKIDLSTTAKFSNLDSLQHRDLYIGINSNGQGSHTLFIKDNDVQKEIHGLNETIIKGAQEKFSQILLEAYFEGNRLKFPVEHPPGQSQEDFYSEIRKFARIGQDYYSKIFLSNDQLLRRVLFNVRNSKDLNFQIGRHDVNYSFPWPLLYDYDLPPQITDGPKHPVCMGQPLDTSQYPESVRKEKNGCPHNPGLFTYCIEGFWGIRHRIEQLLSRSAPANAVPDISFSQNSRIFLCNNIGDRYSQNLEQQLSQKYPLLKVDYQSDLLTLLWNEKSRPAILVVLGHLDTKPITAEPEGPRIITFPKNQWPSNLGNVPHDKWIYHDLLSQKIMNSMFWETPPLPIVFLISCYNASMNVSSLNSLVQDFHAAGAAAVIGTECDITSDLGALFVEKILSDLFDEGLELGKAIQDFNQELFRSFNPLAFVFTCFGNNNLKIVK